MILGGCVKRKCSTRLCRKLEGCTIRACLPACLALEEFRDTTADRPTRKASWKARSDRTTFQLALRWRNSGIRRLIARLATWIVLSKARDRNQTESDCYKEYDTADHQHESFLHFDSPWSTFEALHNWKTPFIKR